MDSTLGHLAIIALLVLINAFLNAAEIAVISVRRARIKQLADDGNPAARRVQRLLQNPRRFIATVQVGVTLTAFFASAFGAVSLVAGVRNLLEGAPLRLDPATSDTVAFIFVTVADAFVVLIFGELVPKTLGIERAEAIALRLSGPVGVMSRLLRPVVAFLTGTTNLIVRLLGGSQRATLPSISEAEIMTMVETGGNEGVVTASEQEMIRNIFEFTDRRVSEIMMPRPDMFELSADMSVTEAGPHVRKSGYARIPIYQDDRENIVGMVFAKDVLGAYIDGRTADPLKAIAHPLVFVPETKLVGELLRELQRGRQNMAIAVDEFGGVSGLLTLEDLLEEIVGDIQDEFEHEESPLEELGPGELRVAGNLSLADIVEWLKLRIRDVDLDSTVAALILEQQGRIPDPGDEILWHDIRFTVAAMDRRRISKVHVKYEGPPVEDPADERVEAAPLH
ncbi:MAG: hemolysin family protein [Chloroflexota bacterium]|nr:hemolysin family protein [Chloroflexota bacterium]